MSNIYLRDFLNEKLGVISRVFQEDDVFHISKITNEFIDIIMKTPENKYTDYYEIYDTVVQINYIPNTGIKQNAVTKANGTVINIYLKAVEENYLLLKYTIIHELIHVLQIWTSNVYENQSELDKIKTMLRKPYLDIDLLNDPEYRYFMYLLYREDLYEISAWAHDAYINAFKYKVKYPNKSNQDIATLVLSTISMNRIFLNDAIKTINTDDNIFSMIITILVGHFSELHGNNGQRFFSKEIFELPIIKQMRKDVKLILHQNNNLEIIANKIIDLIKIYEPKLLNDKSVIIISFIQHLKYWYDKAIKQYGKAIQLGIDDASTKYNRKGYGSYNK